MFKIIIGNNNRYIFFVLMALFLLLGSVHLVLIKINDNESAYNNNNIKYDKNFHNFIMRSYLKVKDVSFTNLTFGSTYSFTSVNDGNQFFQVTIDPSAQPLSIITFKIICQSIQCDTTTQLNVTITESSIPNNCEWVSEVIHANQIGGASLQISSQSNPKIPDSKGQPITFYISLYTSRAVDDIMITTDGMKMPRKIKRLN